MMRLEEKKEESLEEKKKENSKYNGPPLSSQPHPWLVICPSRKTQTFFSISENRCYERSIHELRNTIIRASAQEWLVLEDLDSTDCYLWNPISNDKIQLPPLPYNDYLQCLLSAPPNDPECHVLFLIHETTPDDDDDEDDDNTDEDENSNDDTDTNDDDTDNENPDETHTTDDDTDNENPDDMNDDTDTNDDDNDNENPDDDDNDTNYDNSNDDDEHIDNENYDNDDTDPSDDDIDNDNPDDDANNANANANDDENSTTLYLCKPGYDQQFHKQDMKSIIGENHFSVGTVFKGNFYVLTLRTQILLRLDVDDSSGTISATPMTNQPPYNYFRECYDMPRSGKYFMQSSSSSEAELLYVHILFYGRDLEDVYKIIVFQFDFVNKKWKEMKSIGETAIFLGPSSGGTTCSTRGTNLKKESIYFTKDGYFYIFNLETQSISVSLPCPHISMKNPRSYWLNLMAASDESVMHSLE